VLRPGITKSSFCRTFRDCFQCESAQLCHHCPQFV